ncbi:TPA: FAD/NAD(P)-binding protein [Salmonella enterica subsp. enterica serovar Muenchen]
MFDIVIIGLGATGVSLLSQIQDEVYSLRFKKPEIAVFNPLCTFASGNTFGDAHDIYKVNTPSSMMSVSAMEPGRFEHWLRAACGCQERWPSRLLYSEFIHQTYKDINENEILQITEFPGSVISVIRKNEFFIITDDNGNTVSAHKVVMCLGSPPADSFPEFNGIPGFINHYSQYLPSVNDEIIIAGSSLTAIDAFRYIHHKGGSSVHLCSRNGFIPTCLTKKENYTPVCLSWKNILSAIQYPEDTFDVFTRLLHKELCLLRNNGEFKIAMSMLKKGNHTEYFHFLLERAKKGNLPCQDTLVSTRPYMHKIWSVMTTKQKQKFLTQYGTLWANWRHPVPYEVFYELSQASANEKLKVQHKNLIRNPDIELFLGCDRRQLQHKKNEKYSL